jgi:hypothetical protein
MDNVINSIKLALRITTDAFNAELTDLLNAALLDLGIAGVTNDDINDPLILRAVITYCKIHFGQPDDFDRLKRSYDEQKAQLSTATDYTTWTEAT